MVLPILIHRKIGVFTGAVIGARRSLRCCGQGYGPRLEKPGQQVVHIDRRVPVGLARPVHKEDGLPVAKSGAVGDYRRRSAVWPSPSLRKSRSQRPPPWRRAPPRSISRMGTQWHEPRPDDNLKPQWRALMRVLIRSRTHNGVFSGGEG